MKRKNEKLCINKKRKSNTKLTESQDLNKLSAKNIQQHM